MTSKKAKRLQEQKTDAQRGDFYERIEDMLTAICQEMGIQLDSIVRVIHEAIPEPEEELDFLALDLEEEKGDPRKDSLIEEEKPELLSLDELPIGETITIIEEEQTETKNDPK